LQRLDKRKTFVKQQKVNSFTPNAKPAPSGSLTQKVEILAGDDIDTFADE
jgi:hypothetical protein